MRSPTLDQTRPGRLNLQRVAAGLALVLVTPGALFFVAMVGRSLQPVAHEPARTLNVIVLAFLGLPGPVAIGLIAVAPLAAIALAVWQTGATDPEVAGDLGRLAAAIPVLRRPTLLVATAVLVLGAAMLAALLVHAIVG